MRHAILFLLAAALSAQDAGRIEGRVVSTTGEPVRRAMVRLQTINTARTSGFAEYTDANGAFVFVDLPPGRYQAVAEKAGFAAQQIYPPLLVDSVAGEVRQIELQVRELAVIPGRVVDEDGEPVPMARVTVVRGQWSGTNLVTKRGANVQADDRGEFRIVNVEPGRYYIVAEDGTNVRPILAGGAFRGAAAERTFVRTYYPSEIAIGQASQVNAQPGPAATIEIRMRREPVFSMRGQAVSITGEPGQVIATRRDDPEGQSWFMGVRPGEDFDLHSMPPGEYVVRFAVPRPGPQRRLAGEINVVIADRDVEGIDLRAYPATPISGRVTVENGSYGELVAGLGQAGAFGAIAPGTPGAEFVTRPGPSVTLTNTDPAEEPLRTALGPDGSFTFPRVARGTYILTMSTLPRSYVKAVRLGGNDIVHEPLDVTQGAVDMLEVVLGIDGATLAPVNLPPGDMRGRWLVLWPQKPRMVDLNAGVRPLSAVVPNARLNNLPPGDYYFALFDYYAPMVLQSYGFLAQFNDLASKVTLAAGAEAAVEPAFIPRAAVEALVP